MIYEYALGGYLLSTERGLRTFAVCCHDRYRPLREKLKLATLCRHSPRHCGYEILSLSMTCRQTYRETRLMIFSLNTFHGWYMPAGNHKVTLGIAAHRWSNEQRNATRKICIDLINLRPSELGEFRACLSLFGGLQTVVLANMAFRKTSIVTEHDVELFRRGVCAAVGKGVEVVVIKSFSSSLCGCYTEHQRDHPCRRYLR